MNDLQAALGLVQLQKLEKNNKRRNDIAERYNERLDGMGDIEIPVVKQYTKTSRHNYVIKTKYRDWLNIFLKKFGISTSVHYIPNNHYKIYKKYKGPTPICETVWKKLLTFPLYPGMTNREVDYVIDYIGKFFKSKYNPNG